MSDLRLDTFVCVHSRDVGYLLELVLRSYEVNFGPKGRLVLVTNDVPHLQAFIRDAGVAAGAEVTADSDWLSPAELKLPGWYKQQLIKLRAYRFCETEHFCNLGADTILLKPITVSDLIERDFPVLYYTRHRFPDQHVRFERERIRHIARILRVQPAQALRYVDFINDLFTFNRTAQLQLDAYMEELYGPDPYAAVLAGLDDRTTPRNQFGEWTLYSVFLLDYLKLDVALRNTRPDFLHQVHSKLGLRLYPFNTKVAHFVGKDFNVDYIRQKINLHAPELGAAR